MIVILIIGLLISILIPNLIHSKYQAQWSACIQYERNLAAALESYHAQEKAYPTGLTVLTTTSPPFIQTIPTCPSDGASYGYTVTALSDPNDSYTIFCRSNAHSAGLTFVSAGYPQYNAEIGLRQKNSTE